MAEFRKGEVVPQPLRKCATVDSGEGISSDISTVTHPEQGISSASSSAASKELGIEEVETSSVSKLSVAEGQLAGGGEVEGMDERKVRAGRA